MSHPFETLRVRLPPDDKQIPEGCIEVSVVEDGAPYVETYRPQEVTYETKESRNAAKRALGSVKNFK